ncbi:MAG TPA: carbohydrate-binding family 9-like protein [Pyrinomonadaceae bacterium]|nr:carbohydrate-binding family 9-like protein [Pyrinomonadaceae bacterium]
MERHVSDEADNIGETIEARRASVDLPANELAHPEWERARPALLARYWSGEPAPAGRHAEARLLWTTDALSARFVCRQAEPYVVSDAPRLDAKTVGLWERDVCEVFLAPDARRPEHYFEFEAAPTGEWLDLELLQLAERRDTNWDYRSGVTVAASRAEDSYTVALRVPWSALTDAGSAASLTKDASESLVKDSTHGDDARHAPRAGDIWRVNLYRCVGAGPGRGYLAWRPTETPQPNFHVPRKFGRLLFVE